jgi:ABC-2 type transport system permease protein
MSKTIAGSVKETYKYRHLLYSMVARNLKGRYKSSYLGFAWHFITPAIMIIIFYVVFTGIRATPVENFWAYLCIGMFPFTFLQTNLSAGSNCVVSNAGTIKKMYFPREIVVFAQVISTFITFMIAYVVIIALMLLAGIHISTSAVLFLPLIVVLSVMFATGYMLMLSAITVFIRDVHHFIDAVARLLFFMTPIFYLMSEITGVLEKIIWYNPFTYFIESYHDILYQGAVPEMFQLGVCTVLAVAALIIGMVVFNRLKGKFAEVL